ncbi:hypothetical protein Y032_0264g616 [Ancylostoma ceylanicum]|uniref:Uncharacterized protein n=1 Tax=Ancylostoma ceylanicum TaxID=53326 RepID=A0A016SAC4_9BILA|nr:hypothetical protein Y032_0264g616 [Ancylostoma ceylanicum]
MIMNEVRINEMLQGPTRSSEYHQAVSKLSAPEDSARAASRPRNRSLKVCSMLKIYFCPEFDLYGFYRRYTRYYCLSYG